MKTSFLAPPGSPGIAAAARSTLVLVTLALFLVWSHTFLAFEVLLAPRTGPAPLRWYELVVARFVPVFAVCSVWCFGLHRRAAIEVVRAHPRRLLLCGLLAVPVYNGALYFAMEHRVSGPVASLLTTLSPLYLVVIGAVFLRESVGLRQVVGLVLGFAGVGLVASARDAAGGRAADVLVLAAAPLGWSVYTSLTKHVARSVPPLLWTYLVLTVGSLPLVVLAPFVGGPAMLSLDAKGWALLLYLALAATVFGFAVWTWLLRHLPASTTGFTVFLNPPLTTAGKAVLSALLPASFAFTILPREWVGGAVALVGVAFAVLRRRPVPPAGGA